MNPVQFSSGTSQHRATIVQVADHQWHALDDDQVAARGEASRRPDGRLFLSIDTWHDALFAPLATTMLAALPRPLYTIVDETDTTLTHHWTQTGFTTHRREAEYHIPTNTTPTPTPTGITIISLGQAHETPLRHLDQQLRQEINTTVGWHTMPAEIRTLPHGDTIGDPTKYAAATNGHHYIGLLRIAPVPRLPRIGLLAIHPDHRHQGIGRALLTHTLATLHHHGITTATTEVTDTNHPATTLLTTIGAHHTATNLELILR